jgi:hypothetical protein
LSDSCGALWHPGCNHALEQHPASSVINIARGSLHRRIRGVTFLSTSATSSITPLNHSNDPGSLVTQ